MFPSMGQKRSRLQNFGRDVDRITRFVREYQESIRQFLGEHPPKSNLLQPVAITGRTDIWPCTDAAVVLIYAEPDLTITVRDPMSKNAIEFLHTSPATGMITFDGRPSRLRCMVEFAYHRAVVWSSAFIMGSPRHEFFRSRFDKLGIIAWDVQLPDPREDAVVALRSDFATRNLLADTPRILLPDVPAGTLAQAAHTAQTLLQQYRNLLESTTREEELQLFLADHPVLLYPDHLEVFPKYKLGGEYITDYVFLVQGYPGREYVFVEIEHPGKRILTNSGQFSSAFTQAKDQLLVWETWLSVNHSYAVRTLPGLFRPVFHLVMGRSASLPESARQKLVVEFAGTSRRFSTYDDLADRFEQIVSRLIPSSTSRSSSGI
jgi:hypothetical protein